MEKTLFDNRNIQNVFLQKDSPLKNPAVKGGFSLLFDHKAPIQMKYIDYDRNIKHLGSGEIVNFKIYTLGYKPNINRVKIQIQSDGDPFFSSVFQTDQNLFSIMREDQKLNFDLQQFPTVLIKSLNKIEESKGKVNASLLIYSDGKCKLTVYHTSEYKNIEIISLEFNQENEDNIQTKVAQKYQNLRKKVLRTEERLAKINQIIRQKNPSLLMQLSKTTQPRFAAKN